MKEFGSDFHSIGSPYDTGRANFTRIIGKAYYLADGRQGLSAVIIQEGWKRLWVPEYFCYEIIESIAKHTNVELMFYMDYPGNDNLEIYKHLPYKKGDALLRMNFFGLSDNSGQATLPIPVVEDHSHDLLGRWALFSEADWCFASLRKSLPLAEGGVVWSPKQNKLDLEINPTLENERLAAHRWEAMKMKSEYLITEQPSPTLKEAFRKLYLATENELDTLDYSVIDQQSMTVLSKMDITAWYNQKKRNWKRLTSALSDGIDYLIPASDSCTPFSLVLRTANKEQREIVRCGLIKNSVYPAILWNLPKSVSAEAMNVSHRLLSVHCDGRYSEDDMEKLAFIINNVYQGL